MKAKAEDAITVTLRLCKDADNYYSVNMSITTAYQVFDYDIKADMTAMGTPAASSLTISCRFMIESG